MCVNGDLEADCTIVRALSFVAPVGCTACDLLQIRPAAVVVFQPLNFGDCSELLLRKFRCPCKHSLFLSSGRQFNQYKCCNDEGPL